MEPVSRDVIRHLSQTRVIFRAALMSCSSLVSLRAVYRDCLVSVEHCSVTVTMGFASGEPHTAITASPMLRVSKRLTANVFREPEVEAGTSAADAAHTEAARLLRRLPGGRDRFGAVFSGQDVRCPKRTRPTRLHLMRARVDGERRTRAGSVSAARSWRVASRVRGQMCCWAVHAR